MSADVDIKTGLPLELVKARKKQMQISALEQDAKKGAHILNALKTKSGEFFANQCKEILEAEIQKFLDTDPKCQGILQVLRSLSADVKAAEFAQRKLDEALNQ